LDDAIGEFAVEYADQNQQRLPDVGQGGSEKWVKAVVEP
jgi:hypothetical protein